jgi:isoleucyl-tRNA synthetase
VDGDAIDEELEIQMQAARRAVEAGLAARDAVGIKVRQPLREVRLPGSELPEALAAIIREELNVKALAFGAAQVELDTDITHDLRLEGIARDLVRHIQERRKRSGFNIEDRIEVFYEADGLLGEALERHREYIATETLARRLQRHRPDGVEGVQLSVEGEQIWIGLRRAG